jgi:hypothetical protein
MTSHVAARRVFGILVASSIMLLLAGTAFADTAVGDYQRLRIQLDPNQSGCATAGSTAQWVTGNDAPGDTNSKLFAVHVGTGGCVIAYSTASYGKSISVADQKNLSYEFANEPTLGAGEFYLAVEFNNGDVAYLDPYYCHHDIAVTGGAWQRSDFTGFTSNCGFYVTGATGGFYEADGTSSAWAVYAAAHPDQQVVHRYMVFSFGDHQLDRISLGAGKMYTRSNRYAVSCTTEASC